MDMRGQRYTKKLRRGDEKRASIRKSREHETRIEWTKAVSKDCLLCFPFFLLYEEQLRLPKRIYI